MTKRYVLVRVFSKSPLSAEQFQSTLMDSIRRSFGEFGLARIGPKLIRFDPARAEAVVACNKDGTEDLQAAIGLVSDAQETAITALTMSVSGTLKGLRGKQRF